LGRTDGARCHAAGLVHSHGFEPRLRLAAAGLQDVLWRAARYALAMKIEVRKPTPEDLQTLGALRWPIWTCGVSRFDWSYDEKETCYLLEGRVTVEAEGQSVSFGAGDLVVFPQGLSCVWNVQEPVRKHYRFG
jgi:uncharacterized cupin superfamily protein